MKLDRVLQNYGLSNKQTRVFLACLELDSSPVQKIAKKSCLARSTTYEVLESLKEKGFVSVFRKKKIKYFMAQDPELVVRMGQDNVDILKDSLPQLKALYGINRHEPTTRFYQGKQGMRIILEELLSEASELLSFVSADDLFDKLGDYFYKFVEKRIKKKIPVRVLFCKDTPKAQERLKLGEKELRHAKILSGKYQHRGLIFVWKDKIAMFSFTDDYSAVVIESKELAEVQKTMFDYLWDLS